MKRYSKRDVFLLEQDMAFYAAKYNHNKTHSNRWYKRHKKDRAKSDNDLT